MNAPANIPAHVPADRVFDFDIYADSRVTPDVQGSYAAALANAPDVFWTPLNGGHWMVRRHEEISQIVKDPEYFSVREMQIPRVPNPPFFIPLSLDPPANLPYRQAMMPKFSPKAIRELEPRIRDWAIKIIDEAVASGECDFISEVASRFPVTVFMELMGLPLERLREFRDLADRFFNAHEPEALEGLSAEILGMLGHLIAARRETPADDLVSHFLSVEVDGRKLSEDEILAMSFVLFLGGMDTVTNVTGFSFQHLAQTPDLQTRLAADPTLIPRFVEEGIRSFGVINTPRLVIQSCDRFGVRFEEGDMVLCLLPMGGRDERVNSAPNQFDLDREGGSYLTFSSGPHLCIGHILARAEIRILTEEWLKRVPKFSLQANATAKFRIGTVIALQSLPIRWS